MELFAHLVRRAQVYRAKVSAEGCILSASAERQKDRVLILLQRGDRAVLAQVELALDDRQVAMQRPLGPNSQLPAWHRLCFFLLHYPCVQSRGIECLLYDSHQRSPGVTTFPPLTVSHFAAAKRERLVFTGSKNHLWRRKRRDPEYFSPERA